VARILEQVIELFREKNWAFSKMPGRPVLKTTISNDTATWLFVADVEEEENKLAKIKFYSFCPAAVPEDKRAEMAEFLTRVNWRLLIGNFEMDYSDGEIRYRTAIMLEPDQITAAMVKHLAMTNVFLMGRYVSGILSMIYGNVQAEKALAQIDQKTEANNK